MKGVMIAGSFISSLLSSQIIRPKGILFVTRTWDLLLLSFLLWDLNGYSMLKILEEIAELIIGSVAITLPFIGILYFIYFCYFR